MPTRPGRQPECSSMAALLAGLPVGETANTVNRLCASGLQAIMDASRQIMCGDASLIIACGVESMSRAPFVMGRRHSLISAQRKCMIRWAGGLSTKAFIYASSIQHGWNSRERGPPVEDKPRKQDAFALQSQENILMHWARNMERWNSWCGNKEW